MNIVGSKGCFRKGSLVQLEHGLTKPIEDIKVGDQILSYNEVGELAISTVTETHYHAEVEPLIQVRFWNGSIDITPNHWVLNQYGNFIDIGSLTTKDALIDGMGHLRPIISATFIEPEPVYNLTVEPNHTFICNNIRVHNGGYAARYPIVGSKGGGKGGGGSRPAVEDPDSLRSISYAQVVDLLCEGEIEGLANGAKSIYLNETPLQNQDGTFNYSGFTWDIRSGTQDQEFMPGFTQVESAQEVNTRIKGYTPVNGTLPAVDASPVERTYTNSNGELDGVRLTIGVPALYIQDTTTGDVHGTSVKLKVEVNYNESGWYEAPVKETWDTVQTYSNSTGTTSFTTSFSTCERQYISLTLQFDKYLDNSVWKYNDISYIVEETNNGGTNWTELKSGTVYHNITDVSNTVSNDISPFNINFSTESVSINTASMDIYGTPSTSSSKGIRVTLTGGKCIAYTLYSIKYNGGTFTISGKASSRYQKSIFIPFGLPGTWQIRLSRLTDESIKGSLVNQTWLDLETEVTYAKLRYPNSAYVGLRVDASQFDTIPTRAYDIKLLKIRIPTNYNPLTRTYTGEWDGTFKVAWSNNPAWCLYDLITNDRYGLGNYVDQSIVDKWSLYSIGKYCDELVPTSLGDGYVEPRFTCNLYLQTREDAFKVLNDMASIFRGMLYWAAGSLTAIQDSPEDPSHLFTPANVIDGLFTYSGSSEKARHTVALVSWNDMNDMCRTKVEYVEDPVLVEKYGVIETELIAVGCTSRGQAHRVGEWLLYTEKAETELVTFKTGLEGATARPGKIIKIADPARSGVRLGGRILSVLSSTQVQLDSTVILEPAVEYTFNAFRTDGSIQEVIIDSIDENNIITLTASLEQLPDVGSIWIIYSSSVDVQLFRVLSIIENTPSEFEVSAIKHEPAKYDYIERDLKLPLRTFSNLSINPPTPTNLVVVEGLYATIGNVLVKLSASWTPVPFANKYQIIFKRTEGNASYLRTSNVPYIDLEDVVPGEYTVTVWAINSINKLSLIPAVFTLEVFGKTLPPIQVSNIATTISSNEILLSWDKNPELDIWGYEVRLSDSAWGTSTGYLYKGKESSCYVAPPLPLNTFNYYIKAIDTTDNYSGLQIRATSVFYNDINKTAVIQFNTQSAIPYQVNDKIILQDFIPYDYNGTHIVTEATTGSITISIDIPLVNQDSIRNYGYIINHTDSSKSSKSSSVAFQTAIIPQVYSGTITHDLQNTSTSSSTMIIRWEAVSPEFGLDYYEFTNGGETPARINATYVTIPVVWTGDRTLSWVTVDKRGNRSATTNLLVNIALPGQMPLPAISLTKISNEVVMNFLWNAPVQGSLPIAGYEIRVDDANWGDGNYIYRGSASTAIVPNIINSLGQTWYIKAFDTRNNYSSLATSILLDDLVPPTAPTNFTATPSIIPSGLLISWDESASLDVIAYEVRTIDSGWGISDSSRIYYGSGTEKLINISNTGIYNYYIKARDATNRWSTVQTVQFTYDNVTPINTLDISTIFLDDQATTASVKLTWPNISTQFGVKHYKIMYGTVEIVQLSNNVTLQANWIGTRDFHIYVVDNNGNESSGTVKVITRYAPQSVSGITTDTNGSNITIKWVPNTITINSGYLPISGYEVRTIDEDWGLNNALYKGNSTSVVVTPNTSGNGTWYIRAIDTDNEYSTTSTVVSFTATPVPNISSISHSFFDTSTTSATLTLEWPEVSTPQFGLKHYRVNYNGKDYKANTNYINLPADWVGSRQFTIYTVDNLNRESTGYSKSISKLKPNPPTNFYPQVIDNTVMLTWDAPTPTTLPISHYIIKEGDSWTDPSGVNLGRKDGAFTTVTELRKGTYTYWIATVDTDDVESDPIQRTCEVAEPPDFVFHGILNANYEVINDPDNGNTIDVTYTNARFDEYDSVDSVVLPINITEEYQQHFTNNLWTSPQDQITAGYPIFITPATSSGSYKETWDIGTILGSSKIVVSCDTENIGGLTIIPTIEITSTDSSTWDSNDPNYKVYPGAWDVFGVNFRYVRITLSVSTSDLTKVVRIYNLNVLLNAKAITDSASEIILSQGQVVNFTKEFIDVTSLTANANSTLPLVTVYDYKDTIITGNYSVTSNVCTITATGHGLISGQAFKAYFSSGTLSAGTYIIDSYTSDTISFSVVSSDTSGDALVYPQSFRLYLFDSSTGSPPTFGSYNVSWFAKGY